MLLILGWFFYVVTPASQQPRYTKISGFRFWVDCEDARADQVRLRREEEIDRLVRGGLSLQDAARNLAPERLTTECREERS